MRQTYFCPNCRALIAYGDRFCGNCGTNLKWVVLQTSPQSLVQVNINQSHLRQAYNASVDAPQRRTSSATSTGTSMRTEVAELLADFFSKQIKRN